MVKFLRRTWNRYSKLGRRKKKKQVWRNPKGRDNKMREKRKGYPSVVSIGYRKEKKLRGEIEKKQPIIVKNIKDLEKLKANQIIIIGKVGKKKKIEIVKKANEKKLEIYKMNLQSFLKKVKEKKKPEEKKTKEEKKWKQLM